MESQFFCMIDIPAHGGAPQYQVWLQKFVYKQSADWEPVFVTSITIYSPDPWRHHSAFPFVVK